MPSESSSSICSTISSKDSWLAIPFSVRITFFNLASCFYESLLFHQLKQIRNCRSTYCKSLFNILLKNILLPVLIQIPYDPAMHHRHFIHSRLSHMCRQIPWQFQIRTVYLRSDLSSFPFHITILSVQLFAFKLFVIKLFVGELILSYPIKMSITSPIFSRIFQTFSATCIKKRLPSSFQNYIIITLRW